MTSEMAIAVLDYLKMLGAPEHVGRRKLDSVSGAVGRPCNNDNGDAGIGAIYMLNNFTYIQHKVIESSIPEILQEQLEDDLNKRIRNLKVGYLEIWAPLILTLMDSGGGAEDGKSGFGLDAVKSALPGQQAGAKCRDVKDWLARFNKAFEEVVSLHKITRIENWDVEMKEKLRNEIERMIVPTC
ncbi:Exo70 exocyst complex subunit-domain-containing protein [Phakopsora pachyrhizi]|uniref:Exocyst complex protein EXO70 n=1 Tax=Phakopsora pachyrhizi TaxID=170000 RepID=A0AAV0ARE7_PHAPC|nr:Exo70 exocyst complex subunit-domain-containing protein [Phakopsora pachyrhizi]